MLRSIVRRKLHVSLNPQDPQHSQQANQDALELLGDIRVELLEKLAQSDQEAEMHGIKDFRGLAAAVSYNACAAYFRRKYPRRTSLKNSLRYFLTHTPAYALWKASDEEWVCGFARWRQQPLDLGDF